MAGAQDFLSLDVTKILRTTSGVKYQVNMGCGAVVQLEWNPSHEVNLNFLIYF